MDITTSSWSAATVMTEEADASKTRSTVPSKRKLPINGIHYHTEEGNLEDDAPTSAQVTDCLKRGAFDPDRIYRKKNSFLGTENKSYFGQAQFEIAVGYPGEIR